MSYAADLLHKNKVTVTADIQELVDAGYGTDWTLTIRNLADKTGNFAVTTSDVFKVNKTVINPLATPFKIKTATIVDNTVEVTFTEGVQYCPGGSPPAAPASTTRPSRRCGRRGRTTYPRR